MHLELRHRRRVLNRALYLFWSAVAVVSGTGLALSMIPLIGALVLLLWSHYLGRVVILPTGAALLGAVVIRAIVRGINRVTVRNAN